jgi:hypothetical protein
MDRAGIEHVFLIAVKAGSAMHKIHRHISYERVAAMVKKHPTRFSGLAGVDPTEGMKGLARLEYAIRELGFVGAHLYPHWFEMPPDHARYYPIYAKCAELGCTDPDAGGPLLAIFGGAAAAKRRPADFARHHRVPFPGAEARRHSRRLALDRGNDFGRLQASERLHRIGCVRACPLVTAVRAIHRFMGLEESDLRNGLSLSSIPERARADIEKLAIRPGSKRRFLRDNVIELYNLKMPLSEQAQ